jgi:hypothetical protein
LAVLAENLAEKELFGKRPRLDLKPRPSHVDEIDDEFGSMTWICNADGCFLGEGLPGRDCLQEILYEVRKMYSKAESI